MLHDIISIRLLISLTISKLQPNNTSRRRGVNNFRLILAVIKIRRRLIGSSKINHKLRFLNIPDHQNLLILLYTLIPIRKQIPRLLIKILKDIMYITVIRLSVKNKIPVNHFSPYYCQQCFIGWFNLVWEEYQRLLTCCCP